MIMASELRAGTVIRFEGGLHKIVESEYHLGGGKLTGSVRTKLQNLRSGTIIERRFRPEEKLQRVELDRAEWQYLYTNGTDFFFMNPQTFEQLPIPREVLSGYARFLREDMTVTVATHEDEPVQVIFPEVVELRVASTGQAAHQQQTSALKPAELENGLEIQVPLFIKEGDLLRIDTATGRYLERLRGNTREG